MKENLKSSVLNKKVLNDIMKSTSDGDFFSTVAGMRA